MKFTRQDLLTFAIGAAVALVFEASLILKDLPTDGAMIDWGALGGKLLIAEVTALGRYLATRLPEMFGHAA